MHTSLNFALLSFVFLSTLGLLDAAKIESRKGPPWTDYNEMLERDIQGDHYGFIAGNKLYYVAGSFGAYWDEFYESETLGFTHPLFRDGRARGIGIVDVEVGGLGHDSWGS